MRMFGNQDCLETLTLGRKERAGKSDQPPTFHLPRAGFKEGVKGEKNNGFRSTNSSSFYLLEKTTPESTWGGATFDLQSRPALMSFLSTSFRLLEGE